MTDNQTTLVFLFLVFCGLWQLFGPKAKYPHPPGSVLYVIQTDCVLKKYDTDRMICEMTKKKEWLDTHPKSEWYWSEYSND